MPPIRRSALVCLLLLLAWPCQAARVLLDTATPPSLDLTTATHALADPDGKRDLAAVRASDAAARFRALQPGETTFGYVPGAYWFRFEIENIGDTPLQRALVIAYPLLDRFTLYRVDANGHVSVREGGDRVSFGARDLQGRHPNVLLDFAPHERSTFYLRAESQSSMQVPLELADPRAYLETQLPNQLGLGIYYGLLLALTLYNLLLFTSTRDSNFLWYALYGASYCLMLLCLNGVAFQYFWPNAPDWGNLATVLSIAFSSGMVLQFSRRFLDLRTHAPRMDMMLRACLALTALLGAAALVAPYGPIVRTQTLAALAVSPFILVCALRTLRTVPAARYFALAWGALLTGTTIYAAVAMGLVPKTLLTEYSIQIGSAAEMLLLSFALAYRINVLTVENTRIQREARNELEARVSARTSDLDAALQRLEDANRRLDAFSRRDALTGLYNRRHFDETLARTCRAAIASGRPMALMMIDLDHFKTINDRYGHSAGDACLRSVARLLDVELGTLAGGSDDSAPTLARYGGEEFAIVLPDTDEITAARFAEHVRAEIARQPVLHAPHRIELTASVGVHLVPGGLACEAQDLLRLADARLYAAKRGGRNRIDISTVR